MNGHSASDGEFVKQLAEITEANLQNEQFGVSELAREMGMSRSNLHVKVKSVAKISASRFIRQLRLKKALELLIQSPLSASEVAYKVGFGSVTYFNKCFHDYYGFPPGEAGKRNLTESGSPNNLNQKENPGLGKKRIRTNFIISILFVVILIPVLFIVFNIGSAKQNNLENTIAIMPLKDFSQVKDNLHIVYRLEDQIINKLYGIENLKVVPHSAVELYRESRKSNREIAKELFVSFILQGNVTIIGNKMAINLELIEAENETLLGTYSYIMNIDDPENIFNTQERIALRVAEELKIPLTPAEKQQIVRLPSENAAALYKFNQAQAYINIEEQLKAKELLEEAIRLDSAFVDAFAGLGYIYIEFLSHASNMYLADSYLDSGLMMVEKALSFNAKHQQANNLKYKYFLEKGMSEEAREMEPMFDGMIKNYQYYQTRFGHYHLLENYYLTIDAFYKYRELKPKDQLTPLYMLYNIRECFGYTGFPDQAKKYVQEYLDQTKDSVRYICYMAWEEHKTENFQGALNLMLKGLQLDSTFRSFLIGTTIYYVYLNDYGKAYEYSKKVEKLEKELNGSVYPFTRQILGCIYLKNGKQAEAEYHLKEAKKYYMEVVEMNTALSRKTFDFFVLSGIYAALGDKENALKYLEMLKEMEVIRGEYVLDLKNWPPFDNIREYPEFKDILKDAEAKYQREHERVKKLLIREGIIES